MTKVPNVIGKNAEEANRLVINAGLNISIEGQNLEGGKTVVVAQDPPADSNAEIGTIVTVYFTEPVAEDE
jgi:beta-lactam-binding protein with PASTA domain